MRLAKLVEVIVKAILEPRVIYSGLYGCTVASQDTAGNLDLLPDDALLRGTGLQHVPMRNGLPGFQVKVPAGVRCLLGFTNADPKQPYALLWDAGQAVTEVQFDGGHEAVARTNDIVDNGQLYVQAAGGMIINLWWWNGTAWVPISMGPIPPVGLVGTPFPGSIWSGNPKLLA